MKLSIQEQLRNPRMNYFESQAHTVAELADDCLLDDAATYIDSLEAQLTEQQQEIAQLKLQRMQVAINNSLQVAKLLSKVPRLCPTVPLFKDVHDAKDTATIRRELGFDLINAEREGM